MTDCAAPRHGDEPAEAEAHAQLCRPCRVGLARDLRRLPGLHRLLEDVLATGQASGHGDGTGLPFHDPASECRSQIRRDVTYWARHVTQLRGLDAPPVLEDGYSQNPLAAMCGWLHGQVTWCTFRDWAGDMAGALSEDSTRARQLLDPRVVVRFKLPREGVCLNCGQATMTATIYASDDDKRRPSLDCPACGDQLTGESWLRYGQRIIARREALPA